MSKIIKEDIWQFLKKHTDARIALGRVGKSLPTKELLNFNLSHALARDAIYETFQVNLIEDKLKEMNFKSLIVNSKAYEKATYLLNPNFGRELCEKSKIILMESTCLNNDICIIVSDGLSAAAANNHSVHLLKEIGKQFRNTKFTFTEIILAKQARVALSDEIGEILKSRFCIMLIGERPGLSSPDSLGIYLTYNPYIGRTDADRNCISNIRPQGLSYLDASIKLKWLITEAEKLGSSGVLLKDESSQNKQSELY
ncbi:ethanolamine ammonia-lyase subunit EutC [Fluviispira multicolorata]|uniref:Ethanolamine ammonia-lyase small subunit n=1 Tax=Fluviispira multicolorata TaxID=2654512 RepID=A0A833N3H5_9BACT|nr:ethanolamine ammonia-lyase subunit EutC [Fluviispira multicolorata]KAB8029894.1 ethanolamine ammonia-lyase subunit EutC [Fluviispira multicolorata]